MILKRRREKRRKREKEEMIPKRDRGVYPKDESGEKR